MSDSENRGDGVDPASVDENTIDAERHVPSPGSETADIVPVENWVYWPPMDSADYLDAPTRYIIPDDEAPPTASEVPPVGELPEGGMTEGEIRAAGLAIDVPYEAPMPKRLEYEDTGQQAWTPPPGFRQGLPPLEGEEEAEGGSPGETESGS